jgi:hypothetical protein
VPKSGGRDNGFEFPRADARSKRASVENTHALAVSEEVGLDNNWRIGEQRNSWNCGKHTVPRKRKSKHFEFAALGGAVVGIYFGSGHNAHEPKVWNGVVLGEKNRDNEPSGAPSGLCHLDCAQHCEGHKREQAFEEIVMVCADVRGSERRECKSDQRE